ncbi:MAG TPA: polyphosphate kinase 2, partial [Calditrichia bacterium]|nr:polyphosphate kinase 2 [Calditrichia bacterium]
PGPGEIIFFDRSWYNRAVVEPVMGFCSRDEYERFLAQVPQVERLLFEDGIKLFKLWFSIDISVQKNRLSDRANNPLKQWKLSTTDMEAQRKWHDFTRYKENMFKHTHRDFSPWVIIKGNDKQKARLESMRYVLSQIDYEGKDTAAVSFVWDPKILQLYAE